MKYLSNYKSILLLKLFFYENVKINYDRILNTDAIHKKSDSVSQKIKIWLYMNHFGMIILILFKNGIKWFCPCSAEFLKRFNGFLINYFYINNMWFFLIFYQIFIFGYFIILFNITFKTFSLNF